MNEQTYFEQFAGDMPLQIQRRREGFAPSGHPDAWAYDYARWCTRNDNVLWIFTITDERGYSVVITALQDYPDDVIRRQAIPVFRERFP